VQLPNGMESRYLHNMIVPRKTKIRLFHFTPFHPDHKIHLLATSFRIHDPFSP